MRAAMLAILSPKVRGECSFKGLIMAKKSEKIAKQAKLAVEKWREYFRTNIDEYHKMHQFVLGKQWTDDEEDMLVKTLNKVPLQFNKLATLVNTLLGEQQQNTPQLEIVPLSHCEEEVAQLRQMIVKDIMLSTDAKTVYQVAASQAFIGGFGAFIIDTDYTHEKSFDQDIVYRYIKDATRCYWDVGADLIDKTDGMYCGYLSRMTRQKFRATYGRDVEQNILKDSGITQTQEEIALSVQPDTTENPFTWNDGNNITLIDHYERKMEKDTIYKLSNGQTMNQMEMDELVSSSREFSANLQQQQMMMGEMAGLEGEMEMPMEADMMAAEAGAEAGMEDMQDEEFMTLYSDGEPVRIIDSRPSTRSKIIHYKIAGQYILDKSEFPAEDLPIPFVDQNSFYDKNGKQVVRSFIKDAIDAQRYLNYLGTQSAYTLKISRYDQFMGSKKNAQGLDTQAQWKDPQNVKGMLYYDESPSGAKPEQLRPPELSASLFQQYQRAIDDMYTSTGLYPSRLGQQGNEVSGAAIDARTRQGSYSTYVAFNSINRAITAGGKIVNQMVPRVYDSERVMSLMTPDKGRQNITVNEHADEYGEVIRNDLRKGSFEVRLQAGPSYEGQKAQALESLNMVLNANPQLLNIFADLYAENLPLVNTIEIKNRLKTIVPPEILQAGKTGEMPKEQQRIDPAQQAAMAEAQYKQEQIALKKQELEMKMQEHQTKAEMERMKLEMDILDIAAKLEEQKLRYMAEMDRTHSDNAISHADNITKLLISRHKGMTNGDRNK
jgi:hypothetical protein